MTAPDPTPDQPSSPDQPGDRVLAFRAWLSQYMAHAMAVLAPEPETRWALSEVVRRATDWDSLPGSARRFLARAQARDPWPGAAHMPR